MGELTIILTFILSYAIRASDACSCFNRIILLHAPGDINIISSPNYPSSYCSDLDCEWRIVAPDNDSKIIFRADNLDLRESVDTISFSDACCPNGTQSEETTCSGSDLCYHKSANQCLTIRFQTSPGEVDNYGFQGVVSIYKDSLANSNGSNAYQLIALIIFTWLRIIFNQ